MCGVYDPKGEIKQSHINSRIHAYSGGSKSYVQNVFLTKIYSLVKLKFVLQSSHTQGSFLNTKIPENNPIYTSIHTYSILYSIM